MVPKLLGGLKTTTHLEHVPTLLPLCMMCTQDGFPAADMNALCHKLEERPVGVGGVRSHGGVRVCEQTARVGMEMMSVTLSTTVVWASERRRRRTP